MGLYNDFKVLEGFTTGNTIINMMIAFFLMFLEAISTVCVFFLGLNVVRFWTPKALLPLERYYIFVIIALLILEFLYFTQVHAFSRRYFLSIVVLLMGFMGYGLRLLQARIKNLIRRVNGSDQFLNTLVVIFVIAIITGALIKGSYYWEPGKVSLKIAGRYILSHAGEGKTILTDDHRIAYYADGTYLRLTEDALMAATGENAITCSYDFIAFSHEDSFMIYKKYKQRIADSGYVGLTISLPPGSKDVIILECTREQ
jgi:hypothetical protein